MQYREYVHKDKRDVCDEQTVLSRKKRCGICDKDFLEDYKIRF